MGQVCDENISRPVKSNATAPGRIPSVPALDRAPNAPPSPIPTRNPDARNPDARNPRPWYTTRRRGFTKYERRESTVPGPDRQNAGEGAVTHPDELR